MSPPTTPLYVVEYWKDTEDGWWLIWVRDLPNGSQLTQAETRWEVPLMAQDLIMTVLDCGSQEFDMVPRRRRHMPTWAADDNDE